MTLFHKNKIVFILVSFLVLWGAALYLYCQGASPPVISVKQVQYSFTVKNTTNTLTSDGVLWVYAPVVNAYNQSCDNLGVSLPHEVKTDSLGNQLLKIPISALPPFSSRVIKIWVQIKCTTPPVNVKLEHPELYLNPESCIESDHPALVRQARNLSGFEEKQTAMNIFQWVVSTIKYSGYGKKNRGALFAMTHKKGDCTEFMALFVALCRASGIPARGVAGYICPGTTCKLKPSDYHNWAEAYLDGAWVPVDCQRRRFGRDTRDYIAMNILSAHSPFVMKGYQRFHYQGTGAGVHMNH